MKLLLHTHALLWWLGDDDALGRQARALIADPGNEVLVSVASLWEIVVKVRIGKLQADIAEIDAVLTQDQFVRLDIRPAHLTVLGGLPKPPDHRDPFDHLLLAQAISEDAGFVSEDRHAPRYPVRVITCSDPAA
ncbi:type II toxin-antitoxin system VapC family toxin [Methylobacterium brachiatum]|uniref:type II toxin-antitoxin system VapC family toxin n=1 Tax=Methylobacterium brachiatum TaxID=269660 RepID=UPI000EFAE761|nr:type II toxin-antitoxin system VapC family toxin [Methylobacterium brachiatum]AYO81688.1 type II toxin-antitoxin system VapC family toxin [Methylobacterium brachiatum]